MSLLGIGSIGRLHGHLYADNRSQIHITHYMLWFLSLVLTQIWNYHYRLNLWGSLVRKANDEHLGNLLRMQAPNGTKCQVLKLIVRLQDVPNFQTDDLSSNMVKCYAV